MCEGCGNGLTGSPVASSPFRRWEASAYRFNELKLTRDGNPGMARVV